MWPTVYLPVLALRLASSAEPVRHMTMSFLPDDGLLVGTPKNSVGNVQRCEHPYANKCTIRHGLAQLNRLKPLKYMKPLYLRAKAPGLYGLFL